MRLIAVNLSAIEPRGLRRRDQRGAEVKELKAALAKGEAEMKPPAWPSRPGQTFQIDGFPHEIHI